MRFIREMERGEFRSSRESCGFAPAVGRRLRHPQEESHDTL